MCNNLKNFFTTGVLCCIKCKYSEKNNATQSKVDSEQKFGIVHWIGSQKIEYVSKLRMSGYIMEGCRETIEKVIENYPNDFVLCVGYTENEKHDCQVGLSGTGKESEIRSPLQIVMRECMEETGIILDKESIKMCYSCSTRRGKLIRTYSSRLEKEELKTDVIFSKDNGKDIKRNKIQLIVHGPLHIMKKHIRNGVAKLEIDNPDKISHIALLPVDSAWRIAKCINQQKALSKDNNFHQSYCRVHDMNVQDV